MAKDDIIKHQFKKGQTGNPNGRPKKLPSLDKVLANVLGTADDDFSKAEAIIIALQKQALKGNVRAAEVLLERGWGKVKDVHEHTGMDGAPIALQIIAPENAQLHNSEE